MSDEDEGEISVGGLYLKSAKLAFEKLTPELEVAYQGKAYKVENIHLLGGFVQLKPNTGEESIVLFKSQVDDPEIFVILAEDARKLGILMKENE